mmetsp:Transcript_50667/g.64909  ORF Transcript_50667/g.64909 Transcript_50667/m.64909 type:complete len:168 (+) Transcript_50667:3124-3627(+)
MRHIRYSFQRLSHIYNCTLYLSMMPYCLFLNIFLLPTPQCQIISYFYGKGVDQASAHDSKPNYEAALWWYSRAANAGVASGAYNLGYMYECGLGADISLERAERQYRRAAQLLAEEASKKGGSVGEWFTQILFWLSVTGLHLKRFLRAYHLQWLVPQGLFGVRGGID